jgi:hypothetical protein
MIFDLPLIVGSSPALSMWGSLHIGFSFVAVTYPVIKTVPTAMIDDFEEIEGSGIVSFWCVTSISK